MTIKPGSHVILLQLDYRHFGEHLYTVLDVYPHDMVHIYRTENVFGSPIECPELIVPAVHLIEADEEGYVLVHDRNMGIREGWEWFEGGMWWHCSGDRGNHVRYAVRYRKGND